VTTGDFDPATGHIKPTRVACKDAPFLGREERYEGGKTLEERAEELGIRPDAPRPLPRRTHDER
jgi:hypothetical protein